MNVAGRVLAVVGAIAVGTGTAEHAAAQVSQAPMAYTAPNFDWAGLYVGIYQGAIVPPGAVGAIAIGGIQGGYNFGSGQFLAGVGVQIGALVAGGNGADVNLSARAGLLLTPRTVLYAEAGASFWFLNGGNITVPWYGGGVEFAVNDRLSVSGEFKAGSIGGSGAFNIQIGINWHPSVPAQAR